MSKAPSQFIPNLCKSSAGRRWQGPPCLEAVDAERVEESGLRRSMGQGCLGTVDGAAGGQMASGEWRAASRHRKGWGLRSNPSATPHARIHRIRLRHLARLPAKPLEHFTTGPRRVIVRRRQQDRTMSQDSNVPTRLARCGSLLSTLLLASCASGRSGSHQAINAVHLFGMPVAIRLHQRPGPDAIAVRVYATSTREAHGQPIRSGTLEILAFEGPLAPGKTLPSAPAATWTFTPEQLKPFAGDSRLGTGYQLSLPWTGPAPKRANVTVVARYTAPHLAQPVVSGSATIAVPSAPPRR